MSCPRSTARPGAMPSPSPSSPCRTGATVAAAFAALLLVVAGAASVAGDDARDDPASDPEAAEPERSYLGLAYTEPRDVPASLGVPYARGAALYVYESTPAHAAGLRTDDVLVQVAGTTFEVPPDEVLTRAKAAIEALPIGAAATLEVVRDGKLLSIVVKPGTRPARFDRVKTRAAWLAADPRKGAAAKALAELAKAAGKGADLRIADTLARLRACEERRDPFRLRAVVEAHVRPFEADAIALDLVRDLGTGPLGTLPYLRSVGGEAPRVAADEAARLVAAATLDEMVDRIGEALGRAREAMERALARLPEDERKHLRERFQDLGDRVALTFHVDMDANAEREARNRRTVEALKRVDLAALGEALRTALATVEPSVLKRIAALADAHPQREAALVLARDTPAGGRVEVGGLAASTHAAEVAFRFDLGGDDTYLDAGGAASFDRPIAVTVDWDGDDVYAATSEGRQGAGIGGVGILVDRAGDDRYTAIRWAQGVGIAGAGVLVDEAGDDEYRVRELGQGTGLRGVGFLRDGAGADRYASGRGAQGVGLPGGVGVLRDEAGDDRYVCTGRGPSGYGTGGVFDGWGQGLGVGFRSVASGGIGLLHDVAGRDVYEGGDFAQGGGYFYGLGVLADEAGNDRYLGSRYAQGYAAHQAAGVFVEGGGDDRYRAIEGAAAGAAWDESTAVFHDEAGDDRYEVAGFAVGSAAHNGFAVFQDDKGNDAYRQTPGASSGNSYHGGSSVALAIDGGGGKDRYEDGAGADERAGFRGEDAYFADLARGGGGQGAGALLKKGNLFGAPGK